MRRGEIWWACLPEPRRSEPGYDRPVLIVQDDRFNSSNIRTAVVVALSTNLRLAHAPGNVLLSRRHSGLPRQSVANVSQLLTLDKAYFKEKAGILSQGLMQKVEAGLRLVLSL